MSIYRGDTPLKAYKGDYKPVNIYKGNVKVAGWHAQSVSGDGTVALDGAYNVQPDALTFDGKCAQTVGVWGTNLVTNGDFSNGTTGWDSSNWSVIDGIANVLAITQWGGLQKSSYYSVIGNHTYYCAALVQSDSTLVKLCFEKIDSPWTVLGQKYVSITGSPNRLSFNCKPSTDLTNIALKINDGRTSNWTTFTVDNVILIDLTAAFGAGHEPTAAQMDAMLVAYPNSWFNTTGLLTTDTVTYTPNSPSPTYPAAITTVGNLAITATGGGLTDTASAATVRLCSLPDGTKDTYDAVTGVLTRNVGKVVFDGSADESIVRGAHTNGQSFASITSIVPPSIDTTKPISDRYASSVWTNTDLKVYCPTVGNIVITDSRFVDLATIKAIFAANPVTVYYKLATPTTEQLTPDLPVIRTGIKSLSVSGDVAPTIHATVKAMD